MVTGRVNAYDQNLQPQITLQVFGKGKRSAQLNAVVDTGFTEYLTLLVELIGELTLTLVSIREFTLANGAIHSFETFAGEVDWDGNTRQVEILASDGDPLVGMAMLRDHDLHVRAIPKGPVTIIPID